MFFLDNHGPDLQKSYDSLMHMLLKLLVCVVGDYMLLVLL